MSLGCLSTDKHHHGSFPNLVLCFSWTLSSIGLWVQLGSGFSWTLSLMLEECALCSVYGASTSNSCNLSRSLEKAPWWYTYVGIKVENAYILSNNTSIFIWSECSLDFIQFVGNVGSLFKTVFHKYPRHFKQSWLVERWSHDHVKTGDKDTAGAV